MWGYESDWGIFAYEVNPDDYSIVSHSKISNIKMFLQPGSLKYYSLPAFDRRTKTIWCIGRDRDNMAVDLIEIDVSDVDIDEWNAIAHEYGAFKAPTILTLEIMPV